MQRILFEINLKEIFFSGVEKRRREKEEFAAMGNRKIRKNKLNK